MKHPSLHALTVFVYMEIQQVSNSLKNIVKIKQKFYLLQFIEEAFKFLFHGNFERDTCGSLKDTFPNIDMICLDETEI